jgi:hypothetical protein
MPSSPGEEHCSSLCFLQLEQIVKADSWPGAQSADNDLGAGLVKLCPGLGVTVAGLVFGFKTLRPGFNSFSLP